MGVLIGEANVTRFSYLEYQAIMVCLAAIICVGLLAIEFTMNRFQVLPLLFPGMFSIRERKFYLFDYLVDNGSVAGKLRSQAKMLMRMTLCVVLSYLWQHCVMDTDQQVGTDFPTAECHDEKDCFASELHFMTLLKRQYTPVDCQGPAEDFPSRVVVSCIRFVQPSASTWLKHVAIAHSITQLNLKAFELLVWVAGNSPRTRRLVGILIVISFAVGLGLFFGGLLSEFASSWLSFVTMLSVPMFFHTVYQSAKVLEALYKEESSRVQKSIESHLNSAFSDFGPEENRDAEAGLEPPSRGGFFVATRARSLLKLPGFPNMLTSRACRSSWSGCHSPALPGSPRGKGSQKEKGPASSAPQRLGAAAAAVAELGPEAAEESVVPRPAAGAAPGSALRRVPILPVASPAELARATDERKAGGGKGSAPDELEAELARAAEEQKASGGKGSAPDEREVQGQAEAEGRAI